MLSNARKVTLVRAVVIASIMAGQLYGIASCHSSTFSLQAQSTHPSSFPTNSTLPSPTPTILPARDALEIEKLKAEITKLQRETKSIDLGQLLQTGTLVVALLAASVSFWSASQSQKNQIQSLKKQIEQQEKARMSELLHELGSEYRAVKISAIQALSEYEDAAPFLVNLLEIESEYPVVIAITAALKKNPEISLPLLIQANNDLHEALSILGGKLVALGVSKKEVIRITSLQNKTFSLWLDSHLGKRIQETAQIQCQIDSFPPERVEHTSLEEVRKQKHDLIELRVTRDIVIKATEDLIKSASEIGKPFNVSNTFLQGIILENLDLTGWIFKKTELQDASFSESICRNTDFSDTDLSRTKFKDTKLHDAAFDNSILMQTDFSKALLVRSSFQGCKGYATKFFGAKLEHANFSNSRFPATSFEQCYANDTSFKKTILYRAKLTGSFFNDSDFSEALMNGTEFSSAKMHRVNFTNAKFIGTNLSGGDFNEANFACVSFQSISQFQKSSFFGAHLKDPVFGKETRAFEEYIRANSIRNG